MTNKLYFGDNLDIPGQQGEQMRINNKLGMTTRNDRYRC